MSAELHVIGVNPTRTSLPLVDGIGFNEWREMGEKLVRMADSSSWWIGDWLAYGDRYRRDYTVAMQQLDRTYEALRKCAYVSSHVPVGNRFPDLSWTHHLIVAPLDPGQQRYWLAEALRHGWSKRELEQQIAERRGTVARPPAFTVRAVGELHALCVRAAERAGLDPAEWAAGALERAALLELEAA